MVMGVYLVPPNVSPWDHIHFWSPEWTVETRAFGHDINYLHDAALNRQYCLFEAMEYFA